VLPEILAHQPAEAVLMIGGNDLQFGYPTNQWQSQYSNLVATLQANGVRVKHCLPTPRNVVDLTPLRDWIVATYPSADIINTWTPLLQGTNQLNILYNTGDGVHPNDAGHLILGTIIRTNLP
jgi:lysophospholipase L1-like esterase